MRRYDDLLNKLYLDLHENLVEGETIQMQTHEKIIVWLVGISTGAIALIIANHNTLKVPAGIIHASLLLLVATILFGIFTRLLDAWAFDMISSMLGNFKMDALMDSFIIVKRELSGEERIEDILEIIKFDYGEEPYQLIEVFKNPDIPTEEKDLYARNFYPLYTNSSQKALKKAVEDSTSRIDKATGGPPNQRKGYTYNFRSKVMAASSALFIASTLSFVSAVITFTVGFIIFASNGKQL